MEPAFKLAKGYGISPPEYQLGTRSWSWPLILSIIFQLSSSQLVVRLVMAIISSLLIPIMANISWNYFKKPKVTILTAFATATWYELIYIAPRPFFEHIATILILGSLVIKSFFSGLLLGWGIYLRPQYVIPGLLILWISQNKIKKSIGALISIIICGGIDAQYSGSWFKSITAYVGGNVGRGINLITVPNDTVVQPFLFYFIALAIVSSGLILFSVHRKLPLSYWLIIASILLPHTLIAHKEYRFIVLALPLLLFGVIAGLDTRLKKYHTYFLILLISILGILNKLPFENEIYQEPLLNRRSQLEINYQQLPIKPCGIFDATEDWMTTGGYSYINMNVPYYMVNYPPPDLVAVNTVLSLKQTTEVPDFQLVKQVKEIFIYQRQGNCASQPNYSNNRLVSITQY
jgi:hypothetical protein